MKLFWTPCSCCTFHISQPLQKEVGKESYKFSWLFSKCLKFISQTTHFWNPHWLRARESDVRKAHGLYFSLTRQLRSDLSHLHLKLFINLKSRIWQFISRHCSCPAPTSCLWTLTRRQHPKHCPQCATKVWLSHGHLWSIWTTAFCSRHCQPQKSKVQAPVTETL